ncbi:MAG: N-acetylmuramidase domain-containing protein [Rhizobiaceae bacterium]|nr:N-acetylmuramidase domain-containing protein [Rhizobiaceae bacterium]MCV0406936.1 N-acetylmuramidase domain-containing protein [Rhizobiaceae bacterium]
MFGSEIRREIGETAARLAVEPAALAAVVEVESAGRLFAVVDGRREPLIRFEGHYFHKHLPREKRAAAVEAGLASPKARRVANPRTQEGRWRLLSRAMGIDRAAALHAVSWGVGQVLGAHWHWLGYGSVDDLVAEARNGAAGQLRLMARYIDRAGLARALRDRDWHAFARGYNGPAYARHGYHEKLAAAYRRHAAATCRTQTRQLLRSGSRGADVRALQQCLTAAGFAVAADGWFGRRTEKAVRAFQTASDLAADGIAGPLTLAALEQGRAIRAA